MGAELQAGRAGTHERFRTGLELLDQTRRPATAETAEEVTEHPAGALSA